jgi:excisionase family DNA binding protein
MRRRTEITIEAHRIVVLRRPRRSLLAECATCARQSLMLTPDEAATLASVGTRTIYRCIEAEQIHFTETAGGRMLVCLNSLAETVRLQTAGSKEALVGLILT